MTWGGQFLAQHTRGLLDVCTVMTYEEQSPRLRTVISVFGMMGWCFIICASWIYGTW